MSRCYFHFQNGVTTLDCNGVDLPDITAVQTEAVETIASVLREDAIEMLWNGNPLRLWVTDEPRGAGKTLLALRVVRE